MNIYVANIAFGVSEDELHKIFTEFLWDPFWYGVHGDINEYVDELDITFRPRTN